MLHLLEDIDQIATSDAPVLIQGETGTGKELVALAIHERSRRAAAPFGVIDCAAPAESGADGELVVDLGGARTGPTRHTTLTAAACGTLFLDEIAELPLAGQVRLLRFLRSRAAGAGAAEPRIIAATQVNLEARVHAGQFRADLYHRLAVFSVVIPPLRDRRQDIPLLVEHFLRCHGRDLGCFDDFTPRDRELLMTYDYPGNVRQLHNAVQQACTFARSGTLHAPRLPAAVRSEMAVAPITAPTEAGELTQSALLRARATAILRAERAFLCALLERWPSNLSQAARESGLRRSYLQRLLSKHRLRPHLRAHGRAIDLAHGSNEWHPRAVHVSSVR